MSCHEGVSHAYWQVATFRSSNAASGFLQRMHGRLGDCDPAIMSLGGCEVEESKAYEGVCVGALQTRSREYYKRRAFLKIKNGSLLTS